VSVPQHCEELVQRMPWPEQEPEAMHTPCSQVLVPQHWDERVQGEPLGLQPERPWHTLLLQVSVPQQSEERAQEAPWPEHTPSWQTLLLLQVNTPQQSPLVLQTMSLPWQGPVPLTSGTSMSSGLQPVEAALRRKKGSTSRASRGARRIMGLV
jgi:hypothetical protein